MSKSGSPSAASAGRCERSEAEGERVNGKDDLDPFILTAMLPRDLHAWATALRTEHFPPERNYLEAHVTLFHALPPHCGDEIGRTLKSLAAQTAPLPARLEGVMSLGRGTALKLTSPELLDLRHDIADRFHGMLTGQDQHAPRLHITVQNKVPSAQAKALQAELEPQVMPRDFAFRGLALYRYRGGPWELVKDYVFRKAS